MKHDKVEKRNLGIIDLDTGDIKEIKDAKSRNWTIVLYPDSMIPNWQDRIYRLIQIPFEYIIHDKDSVEIEEDDKQPRKTHVHLICHYGNTTTYSNILSLFIDNLSALGKRCANTCEPVRNLGYMHKYLTHSTPDAISEGKYRYDDKDIVSGNNWDLGLFLELEESDKLKLYRCIRDFLFDNEVCTCLDLEFAVERGCFDRLLPDMTKDMVIQHIKNNRNTFVQICKEINFKKKKHKEE